MFACLIPNPFAMYNLKALDPIGQQFNSTLLVADHGARRLTCKSLDPGKHIPTLLVPVAGIWFAW